MIERFHLYALAAVLLLLPSSSTAGQSWTRTGPAAAQVSEILILGENSKVLLAGTNDGVFRSIDGGDHWERVGVGLIEGPVPTLASEDGQFVLAGGRGFYRSENGGVSWSRVDSIPDTVVSLVKIHPDDPRMIIAATGEGLLRSFDQGATWTAVTQPPFDYRSVTSIEIDPDEPDIMYYGTFWGNLHRSEDRGDRWTQVTDFPRAFAVSVLLIEPFGLNRILAGGNQGVVEFDGDGWIFHGGLSFVDIEDIVVGPGGDYLIASTTSDGLFRLDAGETIWEPFGENEPERGLDLAVGNEIVYFGSSGRGVFRSRDGGATWEATAPIPVSAARTLMFDDETGDILTGLWSGGVFAKSAGSSGWISFGLEDESIVDVLEVSGSGTLLAAATPNSVFRSTDGGASWSEHVIPNVPARLLADPFRAGLVYAATHGGIYKSEDDGITWIHTRFDYSQHSQLVVSPHDGSMYSAGSASNPLYFGGINRSTDGWNTFTNIASSLPKGFYTSVWVSPVVSSRLYGASLDGNFYVTEDLGESWALKASFPFPIWSITGTDDERRMLISTDGGVFESEDGGENWTRRFSLATRETLIHPLTGRLIVATLYGVYEETRPGRARVVSRP